MARQDDDADDSGVSVRIPGKFVVYIGAALVMGSMGVNTALFNATPSDEFADLARIVSVFGEQVGGYNKRVDAWDERHEALRAELLARTASRFTQEDAERVAREQERKHTELEKTDAQAQRAIEALERKVDDLEARLK